jgi:peptidoglycan/xylan/chitin deacetylase (PgdA/CDA1 family)
MVDNYCSIVMYHYVRPLKGSRFSKLKALDLAAFKRQLGYLSKHYNFVTPAEVMDSIDGIQSLPEKAVLLTFDDGYKDHFEYVYPALKSRGIKGIFFPPTGAIYENRLLDVNRLHFVLASVSSEILVKRLEGIIQSSSLGDQLKTIEEYRRLFWERGRYDSANVNYFKKMLQHALPEAFRGSVVKQLFAEYVDSDEMLFSKNLYMNPSQLKEMKEGGMEIGSHGHNHYWLEKLDMKQQVHDIECSLAFLRKDNLLSEKYWFCYPYGSNNETTRLVLKDLGCGAAVTCDPLIAKCDRSNSLTMARLDTNDIPC